MFPYSDKTHIGKDYKIILDFNTTSNFEYNGYQFTVAEVEKMFEHIKFSAHPVLLYYSPDLLKTDLDIFDVYGQIEGVYFLKNVIKVEIKIVDTQIGNIFKEFINASLFDKDTKFFSNVIHSECKDLEFRNLYPSFKKYSHDIGHFEGEIQG